MPKTFNLADRLNALRVIKGLRLKDVARKARVPVSTASQLLRNRMINPPRLSRLQRVIEGAPGPSISIHP